MSLTRVYPDVEGAVRDWLRDQAAVAALVDDRVFMGVPKATQFPLIVVHLVGGGPVTGDVPMSSELIQMDCWGPGRNKAVAVAVKNAVVGAIESLESGTPMNEAAVGLWARTTSNVWLPDFETDQARYVVTAEFAVHAR
jgi:hypothetical protein